MAEIMNLEPQEEFHFRSGHGTVLLLACGALAREVIDLINLNKWQAYDVQCLPAKWHNTPEKITPALRDKIRTQKSAYRKIYVLYGDCGTGGKLDALLKEEGVERIAGPHCYAFYRGLEEFTKKADDEITSFYLTDYLAQHFDKLVWQGLGLDKHPELLSDYFRHYTDLIYLAQTEDHALKQKAKQAAQQLKLKFNYHFTGYGDLAKSLAALEKGDKVNKE